MDNGRFLGSLSKRIIKKIDQTKRCFIHLKFIEKVNAQAHLMET
jgi:hypothetical protein